MTDGSVRLVAKCSGGLTIVSVFTGADGRPEAVAIQPDKDGRIQFSVEDFARLATAVAAVRVEVGQ